VNFREKPDHVRQVVRGRGYVAPVLLDESGDVTGKADRRSYLASLRALIALGISEATREAYSAERKCWQSPAGRGRWGVAVAMRPRR